MAAKKKAASASGARQIKPARKKSSKKQAARKLGEASTADDAPEQAGRRCAMVGLGPAGTGRVAFRQVLEAQSNDFDMAYVFIPRLEPSQERLIEDLVSTLRSADTQDLARMANVQDEMRQRERQQSAVAELGQAALGGAEMRTLFSKAAHRVCETLNIELSEVLELLPGGREALLIAGVGWTEGLVGQTTVRTGLDSQAGHTLQRAGSVIVEDMRMEKRFNASPLQADHGVISGMSVVIGPPEAAWGVLGAYARQRVRFTVNDVNFLQSVAHVLWGAIARRHAEQALHESEKRRHLVKDALPVLIAYCDTDCVYRSCNAAYEKWFGLDRKRVVGRHLVDVIGRDAFAKVEPYIRRVLQGEQLQSELELCYKHGPSRHVKVTYIPHRDDSDTVVGYYAMIEDLSERRQFEQQLLDANNRLAAVVETAADGIVTIDDAGRIESANRAVSAIFGYTKDELLGQNVNMLMPQPHRGEHDGYLKRYQRTGEARIIGIGREVFGRRKDGTTFPLDLAVSEFRNGDQRRYTGILRDISEATQIEEALKENEAQLRLITDSFPALITYVDGGQRIRFVNAAFEEWFGRSRHELQGLTVRELLGEELYTQFRPTIEGVLAGNPQVFEHEMTRRDGSVRQMHVHQNPHRADNGDVLGFIIVITDVTDRWHAEIERAMLETSERERRRIGQDIHDSLGQELTGLSLITQNLIDELNETDVAANVNENAAQLGAGIRRALQRVRRISHGLVPVDEVDRRGLIVALENLAAQTNETGGVHCTVECMERIGLSNAEAATQLFRIAQESVNNAVKHAEAANIRMSLTRSNGETTLSVGDDGCGMPEHVGESTGMGLRIMRYRADRAGGTLSVKSNAGSGTEVICTVRDDGSQL